MTKPKSETSLPVLILYGLDANGQPRAAGFDAAQAGLAIKAAESLKLNVLRIETPDQSASGYCPVVPARLCYGTFPTGTAALWIASADVGEPYCIGFPCAITFQFEVGAIADFW
jgi:hypothetical protein